MPPGPEAGHGHRGLELTGLAALDAVVAWLYKHRFGGVVMLGVVMLEVFGEADLRSHWPR
ncbi:MAG: hypothetical protein DCC57_08770 [Chloroflexi bacterium]|nr:MAG: hypothetical protein DCC57_08770 [Chloroflexota bacterium]